MTKGVRQSQEPPSGRHWQIYLDGLLTGSVVTWLLLQLHDFTTRDGDYAFGVATLSAAAVLIVSITICKLLLMRKRGD